MDDKKTEGGQVKVSERKEQEQDAVAVLKALVDRITEVDSHPEYMAVWECAQLHRGPYRGPQYEAEMNAAKAFLATAQPDAEVQRLREALKAYMFCEQTNGGVNPHKPGTNRHRAFELGRQALSAAPQPAPRISAEALAEMRRWADDYSSWPNPPYPPHADALIRHMEQWAQQPEEKRS